MYSFSRLSEFDLSLLQIAKRWLQFLAGIIFSYVGFFLIINVLRLEPEAHEPILVFFCILFPALLGWKDLIFATRLYVIDVVTADGDVVFSFDGHDKEQAIKLNTRVVQAFDKARQGVDPQFVLSP